MTDASGVIQRDPRFEYGHFTTMRVERGGIRGLALHLERLEQANIAMFGSSELPEAMLPTLAAAVDGVPRPVIARVTVVPAEHRIARPGGAALTASIDLRPAPAMSIDPAGALRLRTVTHVRSLHTVKHVALAPELVLRRQAQAEGLDDCVFTDTEGCLTEGPTSAVVLVSGTTLTLPVGPSLPSVTVLLLERVAADLGIAVRRARVPVAELGDQESCFIANASIGMQPVARIDGIGFATESPTAAALFEAYVGCALDPVDPGPPTIAS